MRKLKQVFDATLKALVWLSALLLSLMIICVAAEVLVRYAFDRPQAWVLEFSEYALLFITFLTAGQLLKEERNITVDIVTMLLSPRARLYLSVVHYIIALAVAFVFAYFGGKVTLSLYERGIYNATIMQVPTSYILSIIPIGGFFLFIQSLLGLLGSLGKLGKKGEDVTP